MVSPYPSEETQAKILDFSVPQFTNPVKEKGNCLLPINVISICSEDEETVSLNQHVMIYNT